MDIGFYMGSSKNPGPDYRQDNRNKNPNLPKQLEAPSPDSGALGARSSEEEASERTEPEEAEVPRCDHRFDVWAPSLGCI